MDGGIYNGDAWESSDKKEHILNMKGKWWIENGLLFNVVDEVDNPSFQSTIGQEYIDTIVSITTIELSLIDSDGEPYVNLRIN